MRGCSWKVTSACPEIPFKRQQYPCGSEPARESDASDMQRLTDTQPSRAGSLPQWIAFQS
nr:hypothetical protein FEE99_23300 [Pseudomonas sp. ef1]